MDRKDILNGLKENVNLLTDVFLFHLFQSVCTFISAGSKLLQLQCLWRSKDSAQVSTLTWALASYTCLGEYYKQHISNILNGNACYLIRDFKERDILVGNVYLLKESIDDCDQHLTINDQFNHTNWIKFSQSVKRKGHLLGQSEFIVGSLIKPISIRLHASKKVNTIEFDW